MAEEHKNPLLQVAYEWLRSKKVIKNIAQIVKDLKEPMGIVYGYISSGTKEADPHFITKFEKKYNVRLEDFILPPPVEMKLVVPPEQVDQFIISALMLNQAMMTVMIREYVNDDAEKADLLKAAIKTELEQIRGGKGYKL